MSYEMIDPIINEWAQRNGLTIYDRYQDYEVRSTDIIDRSGKKFQIWIDPPGTSDDIEVHAWDYKKRRKDYRVTAERLAKCLDDALAEVDKWGRNVLVPGTVNIFEERM